MVDIAQKQRNLALKAKRLVESRVLGNGHARFGAEEGRNTLCSDYICV